MNGANRREVVQAALTLPATGWGSGAVAAGPAADPLMAPGISLALARRRAAQISDVHYAISLDLTGRDSAAGAVETRFTWRAGSGDVILDFRGGQIDALQLNGRPLPAVVESGHVRLPAGALTPGTNRLSARFATPIAAAGAAIIRFEDASDGQTYLYTLLVPSDANLLFPCFDQPDLKARVRWELTAPAGWTVLTNVAEEAREAAGAASPPATPNAACSASWRKSAPKSSSRSSLRSQTARLGLQAHLHQVGMHGLPIGSHDK
ncbi:MAG: hypothetical protein WCO11_05330 [Sphingomonadales bacterium]|jgi:aminopeptidase N